MICKAKPYMGDEPYIFVSYCHDDSAVVYPIIERMVSDGYRIWYDEGISPGKDWPQQIAEKLIKSKVCLIVMTPASSRSHNCRTEMTFALQNRITVLSLKLEEFKMPLGIEFQLSSTQMILAYQYTGQAFYDKLYSAEELKPCKGEKGKLLSDEEVKVYEAELADRQAEIDKAEEEKAAAALAGDFVGKRGVRITPEPKSDVTAAMPPEEQERIAREAAEAQARSATEALAAKAAAAPEQTVAAPEQTAAAPEQTAAAPVQTAAAPVQPVSTKKTSAEERAKAEKALAEAETALQQANEKVTAAEKTVQDETAKRVDALAAWEEKQKGLQTAAENARKLAEQAEKALSDAKTAWEKELSKLDSAVEQAEQKQQEAKQDAERARQLVSVLQEESEQFRHAEDENTSDDVTVIGDTDDDVTVIGDTDEDVTVIGNDDDDVTVCGGMIGQESGAKDSKAFVAGKNPVLVQFSTQKLFVCRTNMTKLGQDPHMCDVSFADNGVISQHHADIIVKDGRNYILDADSTNGTYVDGSRLENGGKAEIRDYAEIGLSSSELFLLAFGETAAHIYDTKCLMGLRSEKTGEAVYFFKDETLNLGRRNPWKSGAMASKTVGRHQADLVVSGQQCSLADYSTYGSYLNDQKMEPQKPFVLKDGDRLRFGEEHFVFIRLELQKGEKE